MSITFCTSEMEASGKLCCVAGSGTDYLRQGHCAGSKCMAWRWVTTHINDDEGGMKESSDTHGYCGLAGVPAAISR